MSSPRLRWGVLGAADIAATAVIPAMLEAGQQLVAVASRELRRAQRLCRELGAGRAVEGYQALLGLELDAVYIPLPNSLHLPWTLNALEAGKHVLCEKPLAVSAEEGERMARAAREAELVLAEAVMYRYHPRWEVVRRLLAEGRVGAPRHLRGVFTFPLPSGPDIRWERELGGGALLDVGSYLVSASRWLLGEPARVVARADRRREVDSEGAMLLEFAGDGEGTSAELAFGFQSAECQELEILGTRGSLRVPKAFTAWRGEAVPLQLRREPGGGGEEVPTGAADPYLEMVRAFEERVRGGTELACEAEDSVLGLRVLDAARRSLQGGGWERV